MNRCLTISVSTFALWGAIVGCSKGPAKDSSPAVAASAASTSGASAVDSERHVTAPAPQNPRDFGAMFQNEAASRPEGTIKADAAMAAFRKDGIELDKVRQHLARPYGARYCIGAMAGAAVALSVCEYIDAEAAKTGVDSSRKIVLANRDIQLNQATSLTVREVEKTPAADAVAKKLFDSFAKLKAS